MQKRQQQILIAAKTNYRPPITGDLVAHTLASTRIDEATYLMERNKPWQSSEEMLRKNFCEKVNLHCQEISII